MTTEILQVRDVPTDDVEVLRARAAAQHVSVSHYLRELIHVDTSRPTMAEALAQIATRDGVEASREDTSSFIAEGRRS